MEEFVKNMEEFVKNKSDNLAKAVDGLDQFTKNWCMNCAKTIETNDLVFRCDECPFRNSLNDICYIKSFVMQREKELRDLGYDVSKFGSMWAL